ncbi:MAG: AAA family ATPase [Acidobacteriota bacterium]|nr:AAA family ATPase [Acidobacteriota bacterium]
MLDSLYVRNFRLFEELSIERVGRVNLIVGLNGSGKSCLLEALFFYGNKADRSALYQLIEARGEDWELQKTDENEVLPSEAHPFRSFFPNYRFPSSPDSGPSISIGPLNDEHRRVTFSRVRRVQKNLFEETDEDLFLGTHIGDELIQEINLAEELMPRTLMRRDYLRRSEYFSSHAGQTKVRLVSTHPSPLWKYMPYWDRISLNPKLREQFFEALRLVEPNLSEVVMVGRERRIRAMVLYKDNDIKVPLAGLGDGMNHLFRIVLALANAAGGMLLIDEFENGLHYSVQNEVWNMIFKIARELNVQVFATTHSWDCIEAFQQAPGANDADAMLFRLGRSRRKSIEGKIIVTAYNHEDLSLSTKSDLDVR